MKHSLLIGEKSALFIENNELFKKKIVDFNDLQNMGIKDVRIISNRADVEFRIGFIPKVYPWQSCLVKKSYILGNSFADKYFNTDIRKDTLQNGKYRTQDITLTPDEITKQIIDLYSDNASGIEHISLIAAKLGLHGYWIFVGENLLGEHSIYCGLDEFVLFVRVVSSTDLTDEIDNSIIYMERFGYKRGEDVEKVCVMKSPIDGFKCLHNGFSDEFLLARLFDESSPVSPVVGPEKWAKCHKCKCRKGYIFLACTAIIAWLLYSNFSHYPSYKESYDAYHALIPQVRVISGQADSLLREITDNLKYELEAFDELNDEFNSIRSSINYATHLDNMGFLQKRCHNPEPKRSIPRTIIVSEWVANDVLRKLEGAVPSEMQISRYTYQAEKHNDKSRYSISMFTSASDELIQKLSDNVRREIDNSVKIEVRKVNNNEKNIKMIFTHNTDAHE